MFICFCLYDIGLLTRGELLYLCYGNGLRGMYVNTEILILQIYWKTNNSFLFSICFQV